MSFLALLARVPPEAYASLGRLLSALVAGDIAKAEREARVTAETVAARNAVKAAYEAGKKKR